MFCRLLLGLAFAVGLLCGGLTANALTPDQRVILLVAPQPTLNLDFRGCSGIDGRISFTRAANTATFFGSNLLLQTANANVPRLDYNYATGACNGLEIEQASTNVAIQNRDLTNAAWVKVTATAALDQTGIDGAANSASSLLATAGKATTLQTVVHVSSTDTYSVYLKRLTGTGEIDLSLDGTTWTAATSSICTLGNGSGATASALLTTAWVRCTITQATVVNPAFGIRIVTNGDKIAVDYNQVEVLGFATSPIATTTVAVARNADSATIATSLFPFNPNLGTLFVADVPNYLITGATRLSPVGSNTSNSFPALELNGGANLRIPGSTVLAATAATLATQTLYKIAGTYQTGDAAISLNGSSVGTGTVALPGAFTSATLFNLGFGVAGNTSGPQWLQQVKYWPQRLPNQTLIQMTQPGQSSMLEPANDNELTKLASNGR